MPPAGVLTLLTVFAMFLAQSLSKTVRILTGDREPLAISPALAVAISRGTSRSFAYITMEPEYAMSIWCHPELLHYCIDALRSEELGATKPQFGKTQRQGTN